MTLLGTLLTVVLAQVPTPSMAPLEEGVSPMEGEPIALTFVRESEPAAGLAVEALYRPNAHVVLRSTQAIGTTDSAGRVEWTPEKAGVVVISWEGGTHNVSVKHAHVPVLAVIIAVFAGVLLLGGSVLFFVQMMRDGGSKFEAPESPST